MNKYTVVGFITLLLFHLTCCLHFENLEICAAYINYPSLYAHYGEKGVPSPENFISGRREVALVYSEARNKLYIFGGTGYGIDGIFALKFYLSLMKD